MTSPFVDRVEYQVIGRDVNASGVFRDVADAADAAGENVNALGGELDRFNRSIDDTSRKLKELEGSLRDLSDSREIVITTNIREVLGSVEDNRQVVDILNDRFENLTVNVIATVDQLVQLNDGLTTIDDNRTAIITLDDDFRNLTQRVVATVDSVVELNDGIETIDDNRQAIITLDDDFQNLTQNVIATVDSVVNLNDGLQTIDDNRDAVIVLDDDFRTLTQNIDATVDSVVQLNDGIQTIDDNRQSVITLDDDFRTLTQNVDATVDSVVRLRDGIQTVDDNRDAITRVDTDFDNLATTTEETRTVIIRLRDDLQTIDDGDEINNLGGRFRDLGTDIENTRQRVTDLDRDIRGLPGNRDVNEDIDVNRRIVQTISSDRDRLERAAIAAGAVAGGGFIFGLSNAISEGWDAIPVVGKWISKLTGALTAAAPPLGLLLNGILIAAAAVASITFVAALGAGIIAALAGGVWIAAAIVAITDPLNKGLKNELKLTGREMQLTLLESIRESNFGDYFSDVLSTIRNGFREMKPEITELFRAAGPLMKPLVEGMLGFAKNALPGMTKALQDAKPIIDTLARWLPKLGQTIGDLFERLGKNAPRMATALGYTLGLLNEAIKVIGIIIEEAARAMVFVDDVLNFLGKIGTKATLLGVGGKWLGWWGDKTERLAQVTPAATTALDGFGGAMGTAAAKAAEAAAKNGDFSRSVEDAMAAANDFIGLGDSQGRMWEAIRAGASRAAEATKEGAYGFDLSTEAGYKNWKALRDIASTANAAAQQVLDLGGSQADAAAVTGIARQKFLETAKAFRIGKADAEKLADAMFGIPDVVKPNVSIDTSQATGAVGIVKKAIASIHGKTVYVNVKYETHGSNQGEHIIGQGTIPFAAGGPVFGPGPKGVDSKLAIVAPGEHILTAREVDAAGGHAAIMQFRRSLLNKGAQPGIQPGPMARPSTSGVDTNTLAAALRHALSGMTLVLDDRTGRTASLIARGG